MLNFVQSNLIKTSIFIIECVFYFLNYLIFWLYIFGTVCEKVNYILPSSHSMLFLILVQTALGISHCFVCETAGQRSYVINFRKHAFVYISSESKCWHFKWVFYDFISIHLARCTWFNIMWLKFVRAALFSSTKITDHNDISEICFENGAKRP